MSAPALCVMDEEDAPECFICTESEPPPRKSACKCIDRHVHDHCLAKMLETTRRSRCPVCAASYTNIHSRILVVGLEPCSRGGAVCAALAIALVALVCAANTWRVCCCCNRYLVTRDDYVVFFASILMTSVGVGLTAFALSACVSEGPRKLARSLLARRRKVGVGGNEVALVAAPLA